MSNFFKACLEAGLDAGDALELYNSCKDSSDRYHDVGPAVIYYNDMRLPNLDHDSWQVQMKVRSNITADVILEVDRVLHYSSEFTVMDVAKILRVLDEHRQQQKRSSVKEVSMAPKVKYGTDSDESDSDDTDDAREDSKKRIVKKRKFTNCD